MTLFVCLFICLFVVVISGVECSVVPYELYELTTVKNFRNNFDFTFFRTNLLYILGYRVKVPPLQQLLAAIHCCTRQKVLTL